MSADYFMLTEHDKEVLGDDLLQCESLMMEPGAVETRNFALEDDARALAVLVGYRDLETSTWRQAVTFPPQEEGRSMFFGLLHSFGSPLKYLVHLDTQQVAISASGQE